MVSRKSHRKHKSHRRRHSRKEGGGMLHGAALSYSLADEWSAKMASGQGGDYLKYHAGQHGGALAGAPLSAIGSALPPAMRGPAHLGGQDAALQGIVGLKDQVGGKRRKHSARRKHSIRRKHSARRKQSSRRKRSIRRKHSARRKQNSRRKHRTRRSKGGALGYAPISANPMLLTNYAKAGLTPEWKSGVEFDAAKVRQGL